MATIRRCYVDWNGLTALPGLSVFYAKTAVDPTGDLGTFFNAIKGYFPTALTWTVRNGGDELDDATGTLTGAWTGAGTTGITGTGGAVAYAAGVGAYVNWATGAVVAGRRVTGRTFLTHMIAGGYDSSGTILAGALTAFQNAANALVASNKMVVWHRPSPGGSNGSQHPYLSAAVPDVVTSVRSRRR